MVGPTLAENGQPRRGRPVGSGVKPESKLLPQKEHPAGEADGPPDDGMDSVSQIELQLVASTDPLEPLHRGFGEIETGDPPECEERHRGHAVLVDRIDGVPLSHAAASRIVMPPPLAERTLRLADRPRTRCGGREGGFDVERLREMCQSQDGVYLIGEAANTAAQPP